MAAMLLPVATASAAPAADAGTPSMAGMAGMAGMDHSAHTHAAAPADAGLVLAPHGQHGAELGQVGHAPSVVHAAVPGLSRERRRHDRALEVAPRTVDPDGAARPPHGKEPTMTAQLEASDPDLARLEEFAGKVSTDRAAAYNAILVHLGDRLGLWRALASLGTATVAELSERSGIAQRFLQEWLAAQAANGHVTYDASADSFSLPVEHASVLADEENPPP